MQEQQMMNSWYLAWLFGNKSGSDSPDSTLLIAPDTSVLTPVQTVRHRIRCLDTLRGYALFSFLSSTCHKSNFYLQVNNFLYDTC